VVFSTILENAILNRNPQTLHDLRFPSKSQIILANKQPQTGTKFEKIRTSNYDIPLMEPIRLDKWLNNPIFILSGGYYK
jgi:hypothetical protein